MTETQTLTNRVTGETRTLTTTWTYDDNGNILSQLNPDGGLTQYEYDHNGNQTAIIDPLGRRTEQRYDDKNQLIETIYPDDTPDNPDDNPRLKTEYDAAGNQKAIVDLAGNRTEYTYNANGLPTGMTLPDDTPDNPDDNLQIEIQYNRAGQLNAIVNEAGKHTQFQLDDAGRIVATRNPLQQEAKTIYDANGQEIAVIDAEGRRTEYRYDGEGRRTQTIFPDGTTATTQYDAFGNIIAETDAAGRTTRYEYDALDRLVAVVQPLEGRELRTQYEYDELGNLVYQQDANGNETRFEFDGLGRQTAVVRPLGQRLEMEYDAVGNVVKTVDFNGQALEYQYNPSNQLTAKNLVGELPFMSYTYDTAGRLDTVNDERGTTDFDYGPLGQLLSRTEPDQTEISYTYGDAGRVETVTTPTGTLSYRYDDLNRPRQVVGFDPSEITTYHYNEAGHVERVEFANGIVEEREYDESNRLQTVTHSASDTTVLSRSLYQYDEVGNPVRVEELNGRTVEYTYDDWHRLTEERISDPLNGNRIIAYTYDAVGNRLTRDDSLEGKTTYVYDDNDRLVSSISKGITTRYTYDENGNLKEVDLDGSPEETRYAWDVENRLIGVEHTEADGKTTEVEYRYDVNGIRVASVVDGVETRYLVDANRPYAEVIEEYAANGETQAAYVRGLDLISQQRGDESRFYLQDGHSGVRLLTDELGTVTDSYEYGAYGDVLSATGTTENPYLYRGEWWDAELGLQYLRARYYEPETGRFLSPDPFEGVVESPVSRHRYLYGNANPVVFEDPSGEVSAVAGELQASNIASILAKISLPIPGLVRAAGLAGAWFARRRGDYNLWSGKAYPVKWKLSEPGIEPPYFWPGLSSVTGTKVEASTTFIDSNYDEIEREAEWIVGTLDFSFNIIDDGISTSQLPYKGDSFKAYTHKKAGTHPIILTPFTIGGKISASLAPGTDFNASFKSFLMGVGFAGIASTNSAYLSLSASGYVGFSILRPGSDDYNPVNKLAT